MDQLDCTVVYYIKQLSPSDAASSKQIKLPRTEARRFCGDLRHKQRSMVTVLDHQHVFWEFLCTCYGCQYALSRVAVFCNTYQLRAGQYLLFYKDTSKRLRIAVTGSLPPRLQQQLVASRSSSSAQKRQYSQMMSPRLPADAKIPHSPPRAAAAAGTLATHVIAGGYSASQASHQQHCLASIGTAGAGTTAGAAVRGEAAAGGEAYCAAGGLLVANQQQQQQQQRLEAAGTDDTRVAEDQLQQQDGYVECTVSLTPSVARLCADDGVQCSAAAAAAAAAAGKEGAGSGKSQHITDGRCSHGVPACSALGGQSLGLHALDAAPWQQLLLWHTQQQQQQQECTAHSCQVGQQQQECSRQHHTQHLAGVGLVGTSASATQAAAGGASSISSGATAYARATDSPSRQLVCYEQLMESPPAAAVAALAGNVTHGSSSQRTSATQRLKIKWRTAANATSVPGATSGSSLYNQDVSASLAPAAAAAAAAPRSVAAPAAAGELSPGSMAAAAAGMATHHSQPADVQGELAEQQDTSCATQPAAGRVRFDRSQQGSLQPEAVRTRNSSCADHLLYAALAQQQQHQQQQQMTMQPPCVSSSAQAARGMFAQSGSAMLLGRGNGLLCELPTAAAADGYSPAVEGAAPELATCQTSVAQSDAAAGAGAAAGAAAASEAAAMAICCGCGSSNGSNSSSSSDDGRAAGLAGIHALTLQGAVHNTTQLSHATKAAGAAAAAVEPTSKKHRGTPDSRPATSYECTTTAYTAAADAGAACVLPPASNVGPNDTSLLQHHPEVSQQQLEVHSNSQTVKQLRISPESTGGSPVWSTAALQGLLQPTAAAGGSYSNAEHQQQQQQWGASSFASSCTAAANGQLLPLFQPARRSSSISAGTAAAVSGASPGSVKSAAGTAALAAAAGLITSRCMGVRWSQHLQQLLLPLAVPPFSSSQTPAAAAAAAAAAAHAEDHRSNATTAASPQHASGLQMGAPPVKRLSLGAPRAQRVPHHKQQQQQQRVACIEEWFAVSGLLMLAGHS